MQRLYNNVHCELLRSGIVMKTPTGVVILVLEAPECEHQPLILWQLVVRGRRQSCDADEKHECVKS